MICTVTQILCAIIMTSVLSQVIEGGSACPPRESIYPCFCTNIAFSKKQVFTDISCRHISHVNTLTNMFFTLRSMHIDRFIIYDSFWEKGDQTTKRLPNNWFSQLKIKDFQIADSELSQDIVCGDLLIGCPNNVATTLSIINSSSADNFVTSCQSGRVEFSWISCMEKLKNFNFNRNNLKVIGSKFFDRPLNELLVANFSRNAINSIENGAFRNLPKLTMLDLSHNMITDIRAGVFEGVNMKALPLTHLDLSSNYLKQLSPDIFKLTPYLRYFSAGSNRLEKLPETDWKHLSKEIRNIDLMGNPLRCDCHIIWINCTLKVHATVTGFCINDQFSNTPLRRVSIYMSKKCVNGQVKEGRKNETRNACANWGNPTPAPLQNLRLSQTERYYEPRNSRRRS